MKNPSRRFYYIVSFRILLTFALPFGALADDHAIGIIHAMEDLYRGAASVATISMTVYTPRYQRTMKMTSESLGAEKSLIRVLSPKRDRGVSTLKLGNAMWNYFPKINKVIKIPPSMMMGAWMGSDFTNDDLVKQTSLTDEYNLSMQETDMHYEIILIPKAQTVTVWGKISYLIDKVEMLPIAQHYYDDHSRLIRTLSFESPRLFGERKLPAILVMTPHKKKDHKTIIVYETLEFSPPSLTDKDADEANFSLRNLKQRF